LDTNKAVVGAVRELPLRLISIGLSPQLRNSYTIRYKFSMISAAVRCLGVRSQKTYPVGWPLTPLTALLLLEIAMLCLVVAPCQKSHRLRLKGCFL
jgi:hypothetical protein